MNTYIARAKFCYNFPAYVRTTIILYFQNIVKFKHKFAVLAKKRADITVVKITIETQEKLEGVIAYRDKNKLRRRRFDHGSTGLLPRREQPKWHQRQQQKQRGTEV